MINRLFICPALPCVAETVPLIIALSEQRQLDFYVFEQEQKIEILHSKLIISNCLRTSVS